MARSTLIPSAIPSHDRTPSRGAIRWDGSVTKGRKSARAVRGSVFDSVERTGHLLPLPTRPVQQLPIPSGLGKVVSTSRRESITRGPGPGDLNKDKDGARCWRVVIRHNSPSIRATMRPCPPSHRRPVSLLARRRLLSCPQKHPRQADPARFIKSENPWGLVAAVAPVAPMAPVAPGGSFDTASAAFVLETPLPSIPFPNPY